MVTFISMFHMPLFFIISGYLYKNRCVKEIISKTGKKTLCPYFFTGLIIWLLKSLNGEYTWFISLFFANGSRPLFNNEDLQGYMVGPLWFLIAYIVSLVLFHYLLKISKLKWRFFVIFFLFEVSILISKYIGLLPLDILPAISGTLFLFVGYSLNHPNIKNYSHRSIVIVIGAISVFLCLYCGSLSMASHRYGLNFLQIIAAVTVTLYLYYLISRYNKLKYVKTFGVFGKYTLPIMCVHAIDWNLKLSDQIASFICNTPQLQFIPSFMAKAVFVGFCVYVIKYTPPLKYIYSI